MQVCRVCGRKRYLIDYEKGPNSKFRSECIDCQDRKSGAIKESVRLQNEIDEIVKVLDSSMNRLSELTNYERVNEICVWLFEKNKAKQVLKR